MQVIDRTTQNLAHALCHAAAQSIQPCHALCHASARSTCPEPANSASNPLQPTVASEQPSHLPASPQHISYNLKAFGKPPSIYGTYSKNLQPLPKAEARRKKREAERLRQPATPLCLGYAELLLLRSRCSWAGFLGLLGLTLLPKTQSFC